MTRAQRLVNLMPPELDGVLVTCEINQSYLCGFDYTDGYVLVTRRHAYLLTDFRYIEAAKAEADEGFEVVMFGDDRIAMITRMLADNGVKTLGYEDRELTCAALSRLHGEYPGITFAPIGGLIADMREYKDESEKDRITAAQRIAEQAFDRILGFLSPDVTEQEVAVELEYTMRRLGASGPAFDTIAVSGRASSQPHGVPRPVKLEKGFLTLDFGAVYRGYLSDMTRTVCLGRADEEMKRLYDTVLAAQTAVLEVIEAGKTCRDMDKIARDIIDRAGYRGCFGHSLGHGVGRVIHEAPNLSPRAEGKILREGHVVTVEPGIYLEGRYGVRIEDMVYIGAKETVNLTACPKKLIEL